MSGCDSDSDSSNTKSTTICDPALPACAQEDADQDEVLNQFDDFPLNPRCHEMNNENCLDCGQGCARGLFCQKTVEEGGLPQGECVVSRP